MGMTLLSRRSTLYRCQTLLSITMPGVTSGNPIGALPAPKSRPKNWLQCRRARRYWGLCNSQRYPPRGCRPRRSTYVDGPLRSSSTDAWRLLAVPSTPSSVSPFGAHLTDSLVEKMHGALDDVAYKLRLGQGTRDASGGSGYLCTGDVVTDARLTMEQAVELAPYEGNSEQKVRYRHEGFLQSELDRSSNPPFRASKTSRIRSGWVEFNIVGAQRSDSGPESTYSCSLGRFCCLTPRQDSNQIAIWQQ